MKDVQIPVCFLREATTQGDDGFFLLFCCQLDIIKLSHSCILDNTQRVIFTIW